MLNVLFLHFGHLINLVLLLRLNNQSQRLHSSCSLLIIIIYQFVHPKACQHQHHH